MGSEMCIRDRLFILWVFTPLFSQTKLTKPQLEALPNTIENQFLKTYSNAKKWHEYKMIAKTDFLNFQKSVLDSVSTLKKSINVKNQLIVEKQNNITKLESEIKTINESLNTSKTKENSINLFGALISKELYNSIVWGIIGLLTLAVAFFVYKYKNNISITKKAKESLVDIEEEFNNFRKKTIEKEQKLRRQLHDEMNKNRGA